jgi:hypothetical protein
MGDAFQQQPAGQGEGRPPSASRDLWQRTV